MVSDLYTLQYLFEKELIKIAIKFCEILCKELLKLNKTEILSKQLLIKYKNILEIDRNNINPISDLDSGIEDISKY